MCTNKNAWIGGGILILMFVLVASSNSILWATNVALMDQNNKMKDEISLLSTAIAKMEQLTFHPIEINRTYNVVIDIIEMGEEKVSDQRATVKFLSPTSDYAIELDGEIELFQYLYWRDRTTLEISNGPKTITIFFEIPDLFPQG